MKILIFGQFSNNRGDEAAGRAMIYGILDELPDAKIYSYYCNERLIPVVTGNEKVINIFKKEKGAGRFVLLLIIQFFLDRIGIRCSVTQGVKKLIELVKDMDIVCLSPGGPYIGDMYDVGSEMLRLMVLLIAQKYKKKTMIYGPSMGPFKTKSLRHLFRKKVLDNTTLITVRDYISFNNLKKIDLKNKNYFCTLDAAIQRRIKTDQARALYQRIGLDLESNILVGVTPITLAWHPKYVKRDAMKKIDTSILHELSLAMINTQKKLDCKYVFFPQLFGTYTDMPVIRRLMDLLKDDSKCFVLPGNFDSDKQQIMISKLKFFIGMRYHSIVFSAKMCIPSVGIIYEHKAKGFMQRIGMEEYMIDVDSLKADILCKKVSKLIVNHGNIVKHLHEINANIVKESRMNTDFLLELSK